jgi:hypothetical protein
MNDDEDIGLFYYPFPVPKDDGQTSWSDTLSLLLD